MRDFLMVLLGTVDNENSCIKYKNVTITRYGYKGLFFEEDGKTTLKHSSCLWMLFDSRLENIIYRE